MISSRQFAKTGCRNFGWPPAPAVDIGMSLTRGIVKNDPNIAKFVSVSRKVVVLRPWGSVFLMFPIPAL